MISGSFNQESQLLYYTSDQISSTRVVTDGSGTVVYAAAHEPYGGIQKTWTSAYDPMLKFSGKPRDPESELDYFGARYYDRSLYRFLSVDPVIKANFNHLSEEQGNLYSYCANNPISLIDPDGCEAFKLTITRYYYGITMTTGTWATNNGMSGATLELPDRGNRPYISCIPPAAYYLTLHLWKGKKWTLELHDTSPRELILIHIGNTPEDTDGCVLVGVSLENGALTQSEVAWTSIMEMYWEWSWNAFWEQRYLESRTALIQDSDYSVIIVGYWARWVMEDQ